MSRKTVIDAGECSECGTEDRIIMHPDRLQELVREGSDGMGSHGIDHGSHERLVYFTSKAEYVGDSIEHRKNK